MPVDVSMAWKEDVRVGYSFVRSLHLKFACGKGRIISLIEKNEFRVNFTSNKFDICPRLCATCRYSEGFLRRVFTDTHAPDAECQPRTDPGVQIRSGMWLAGMLTKGSGINENCYAIASWSCMSQMQGRKQ